MIKLSRRDEIANKLRTCYKNGDCIVDAADSLGIATSTAYAIMKEYRILTVNRKRYVRAEPPTGTGIQMRLRHKIADQLREGYVNGGCVKDMAKTLGISGATAYMIMNEYNVKFDKSKYARSKIKVKTERNKAILKECQVKGTSMSDVAKKYGITRQRVDQIVKREQRSTASS